MSTYSHGQLVAELIRDEAEVLYLYDDKTGRPAQLATGGNITAGVGHNLTAHGISQALSREWLDQDIAAAERALDKHVSWWRLMTDARQRGILNMVFNMGWSNPAGTHGLVTFKNTLALMQGARWLEVGPALRNSIWASQVGARAERIIALFVNG